MVTACSGLIVACGGLLTGLTNAGYIGHRAAKPNTEATAPAAFVANANAAMPEGPRRPRHPSPLREYRIGSMSDGFAFVREAPSVDSVGLKKLPTGTHLECGHEIADTDRANPRRWRFCPEYDGYVSARLLIETDADI